MPQVADEKVVQIKGFEGLNLREPRNAIGEKDLSDAINFDLGRAGELIKRTGFKTVGIFANSCQLLGFFNTDSRQEFVAANFDGAVWRIATSTDSITWTDRGAVDGTPQHGVQYIDKFYIVQTGGAQGIYSWDGALAAISGTPNGTYNRIFKDRMFVINSVGAGVVASRIYYSKIADFGSTGWPATNYVGVGEGDGDRLIAAFNVQDILIVFKTGAAWILYVQGDPTLWILRPFKSEVGCISKNSLVLFDGLLYFCSANGVHQTDGNTVREISSDVSPVFDDIVVSSSTINQASAFVWEDKYVLSLETFPVLPTWNSWSTLTWNDLAATRWAGAGSVVSYLVYHIRPKGWTKWQPAGDMQPHIFVSISLTATLKGVYASSRQSPGKIYKFGEAVYQDDSTNYEVSAETKEFNFGAPTEMKRGKWIGVELRGVGAHAFTHVVDGTTKPVVPITTALTQLEHKIKGPEYFRVWRVRVNATHPNPVSLFGFHMHLSRRRHLADTRG